MVVVIVKHLYMKSVVDDYLRILDRQVDRLDHSLSVLQSIFMDRIFFMLLVLVVEGCEFQVFAYHPNLSNLTLLLGFATRLLILFLIICYLV
jgi:hypothetical protein